MIDSSAIAWEREQVITHGYTVTDFPVYNAGAADKHLRRLLGPFGKILKRVDGK